MERVDGNSGYDCQCVTGYRGQHCEAIQEEQCPTNPCSNGGTCVVNNSTGKHNGSLHYFHLQNVFCSVIYDDYKI